MADLILSADLPTGWEVSQSSDGEVGPLTFRNASTGLCDTFSLKKDTYTITVEEKMALKSNDKSHRAEIVIDPVLLESHKGARMRIQKKLISVG